MSYISIEKLALLWSSLLLDFGVLLLPAIASLASHPKEEEEDDNASRANAAVEATGMIEAVDPRFIILLDLVELQRSLNLVVVV